MISKTSINMVKASIGKTVTVVVVSVLVKKYVLKMPGLSFDNVLMINTLATIGGFAIYDLFIYKLNDKIKLKGSGKAAWKDVLKFGSMMIGKELILSHYNGVELSVNKLKNIGIGLLGFVLYDLLILPNQPKLATTSSYKQDAFSDTIKTVIAFIINDLIPDRDIEIGSLPTIFSLLIAVPIYHLVVNPIIIKK